MSRVRPKPKKPIIGVAGGIGAGKSSVALILESLGAVVIDFDRLAHEELDTADVVTTLREWWGDAVRSRGGGPDREEIAAIVFDNPCELKRLEDLLYPRLVARCDELVAGYVADPDVKAIVLDAPKLFEAGLSSECDSVIFVDTEWSVRVRRVQQTRGWTARELTRREKLQKALDMKKASADHVVAHHSDSNALRSQIERVFSSVMASCA